MSIITVTKDNFDEVVANNETLLLDFYADWCGPCRMMAPVLHEIAEENPEITVGKINVDNDGALATKFGVVSIPMFVVIKNGKQVNSAVGSMPKDSLLNLLK